MLASVSPDSRRLMASAAGSMPHLGLCRAAYLNNNLADCDKSGGDDPSIPAACRGRDLHAREFARTVVRQQNDLLKAAAKLTPRERQVLALVVRGWLNRQIAHELSIAEGTVEAHRKKIMQKAKVKTRAQLVSFAERLAMIGVL